MKLSTVFIAPPDQHLLVGAGHRLVLSSAERIGFGSGCGFTLSPGGL